MHYLGIDVGKRESTYFVLDESGRSVAKGRIATCGAAAGELVDVFISGGASVEVALESGNATFGLAREMVSRGADVFVVHPLDNALIARSRKKTDGIDAKTLARQRHRGMLPTDSVHIPSRVCEDLRRLLTARHARVTHRTRLTNQVLAILSRYQVFPAKRSLASTRNWVRLRRELGPLSRPERVVVRQTINTAVELNTQVVRLEHECDRILKRDFAFERELLLSIPGVGLITSASTLAWGYPLSRFKSARHFASYAGLTPRTRQSGERRIDGGTARTGNAHLGRNFVQAALALLRSSQPSDELHAWYQNVQRRRGWKHARVGLARKIASVAYGVLKDGSPYDPAHISKTLAKQISKI